MKNCEYPKYLKHLQTLNKDDLLAEGRKLRSADRTLEMITSKLYWCGLLQFMNRAIEFFGPKFEISTIYTIVLTVLIGYLIIAIGFFMILWHAYNSIIEKHIFYDDYCENMKNQMVIDKEKHG